MARIVRAQSASSSGKTSEVSRHRDALGHLDPRHEKRLLKLARDGHNADGDATATRAFIAGRKTREDLGEELGEAYLESATSGEPSETERLDQVTADEEGGPFVTTLAEEEYAIGPDESNTEDATREPFPRTSNLVPW